MKQSRVKNRNYELCVYLLHIHLDAKLLSKIGLMVASMGSPVGISYVPIKEIK